MKSHKKVTALIILIMIVIIFAGCGSDDTKSNSLSTENASTTNAETPKEIDEKKKEEAKQFYEQAKSLYIKSDFKEGLNLINNALEIDSNNIDYLRLKVDLLFDLKEYTTVIDICKKVIKQTTEPKTHDYWLLAQAYEELGDLSMADDYYNKAITVSKDKKSEFLYWVGKANIAHKMNNYDKAIEYFRKAANVDSSSHALIDDVMSKFYDNLGNPTEMLKYEDSYRTYNKFVRNNLGANLDEEIKTLNTALSNGQSYVDGNFLAIYQCVSCSALIGVDLYQMQEQFYNQNNNSVYHAPNYSSAEVENSSENNNFIPEEKVFQIVNEENERRSVTRSTTKIAIEKKPTSDNPVYRVRVYEDDGINKITTMRYNIDAYTGDAVAYYKP